VKIFSDDEMRALLPTTRPYSLMILRKGPKFGTEGSDTIIWEHGRRNFGLRDSGVMPIVLPVPDESDVCGVGVFTVDVDEAMQIMDGDPGVVAGIFTFEVHASRGFPGSSLPA
jgi:hypothetical protein